jgi:Tol biopolymer transport system component/DNA-binding winged helix-turn-helix (wHTH) protein
MIRESTTPMADLNGGADDKRLYAFGPFVADPAGFLYRDGALVALTLKSFEVLINLIERRDRVVKKDELIQLVWPDTFVEENNLARHVSTIRKALGDHAQGSAYIITIAGRGYRFVAPVQEAPRSPAAPAVREAIAIAPAVPDAADHQAVAPVDAPPHTTRRFVFRAAIFVAAALAVGTIIAARGGWRTSGSEAPNRRLWQLTTGGGLDTDATWAPDGQRIAYASDRDGNFDIWVQSLGDDRAAKLTASPAHDWEPAWSPDGKQIAYRSERDSGGLFVVSSSGGEERRITTFGFKPKWSSRSGTLLFADSPTPAKLYLVGADGTNLHRVLVDFLADFRLFYAAWHSDGRRISIYGNHKRDGWSFWTVMPDGTQPVRSELTPEVQARIKTAAVGFTDFGWSPHGDAVFLEGRSADAVNVWRVAIDPETLVWRDGPERLTIGSGSDTSIVPSPDGRKLAFTAQNERTRLWAIPFDATHRQVLGAGKPMNALSADALYPDVSRDGSQVVYRISRRGEYELWRQSLADGTTHHFATSPDLYTPRLSANGGRVVYRRIVNDGKDNFLAFRSADDDVERPLTSPTTAFLSPSDWSSDGSWILGSCERGTAGMRGLCLLPVAGAPRAETQMRVIATDPDRDLFQGRFSPDQRWIAFLAVNRSTSQTIYVMDPVRGQRIPITEGSFRDDKPRWSPDGKTLYFVSNRSGFAEVWGRGFDSERGEPSGAPFRITTFESPREHISWPMITMELAVAPNEMILPIVESSGSVWILENIDR